jgi:Ran GTPase-activating protein (RanGAP) involved in mRNA processing and transport
LDLDMNLISDIKVFKQTNFDKLEKLNMCGNRIDEKKYKNLINYLKSELIEFTYQSKSRISDPVF